MSPFDSLARILSHELNLGCTNRSVIGGLESFVENWAERYQSKDDPGLNQRSRRLVDCLRGYTNADPEARRKMLRRALTLTRESGTNAIGLDKTHIDVNPIQLEMEQPGAGAADLGNSHFTSGSRSTDSWLSRPFMFQSYEVVYRSGHNGFNHYLSMYPKKGKMPGVLELMSRGIHFNSTTMRTAQKFSFGWDEINGAKYRTEGIFFRKTILEVETKKYPYLRFETQDAAALASTITRTVSQYAREVQRNKELEAAQIAARDLDSISPARFEKLIGDLVQSIGYNVRRTGGSGDQGVDLICRDSNSNEIIIQCKRYSGTVGASFVREFYGALLHCHAQKSFIVTTGRFTEPAIRWARGKPIDLIDRTLLAELLDRYLPPKMGQNRVN